MVKGTAFNSSHYSCMTKSNSKGYMHACMPMYACMYVYLIDLSQRGLFRANETNY